MGWAEIVTLIVTYGPSAVALGEKLWQLATSGKDPTQDDWNALKALAQQTPVSQMKDALTRAGVPLDDPKAVALLALVS